MSHGGHVVHGLLARVVVVVVVVVVVDGVHLGADDRRTGGWG